MAILSHMEHVTGTLFQATLSPPSCTIHLTLCRVLFIFLFVSLSFSTLPFFPSLSIISFSQFFLQPFFPISPSLKCSFFAALSSDMPFHGFFCADLSHYYAIQIRFGTCLQIGNLIAQLPQNILNKNVIASNYLSGRCIPPWKTGCHNFMHTVSNSFEANGWGVAM